MTPSSLIILGSCGSVGTQAIDIAAHLGIAVEGICAHSNIASLEAQIRRFGVKYCAVFDPIAAEQLRANTRDTNVQIFVGTDGICELIGISRSSLVINSIVGAAGLRPTLATIDSGKNLALANKESLVVAGDIVMRRAREMGVKILPVDSEHSAIWQCLVGEQLSQVRRIILTASGGPFFGKTAAEIAHFGPAEALAHPTWNMGKKISVDSATMMNKGLEVIEAAHLFALTPEQIGVVVHRESIVHSMVEFADSSTKAQLSTPDMRECIQYAITHPDRLPSPVPHLDWTKIRSLTFAQPDGESFPLLPLAFHALREGGSTPAVLNAANEAAVALFLEGKITFGDISTLVCKAVHEHKATDNPTIEQLLDICENTTLSI